MWNTEEHRFNGAATDVLRGSMNDEFNHILRESRSDLSPLAGVLSCRLSCAAT
jgi:hypothetical protein